MILNLAVAEGAALKCELSSSPESISLAPPGDSDVEFGREVTAQLDVRRVAEEYFAVGTLSVQARFKCVRCLSAYEAPLSTGLDMILHRVPEPQESGPELGSYVELPLGTAEFDLGPHVREALLLEFPQAPHCREDCRGLCPQCGVDLNKNNCSCAEAKIDPRWEALRLPSTLEK